MAVSWWITSCHGILCYKIPFVSIMCRYPLVNRVRLCLRLVLLFLRFWQVQMSFTASDSMACTKIFRSTVGRPSEVGFLALLVRLGLWCFNNISICLCGWHKLLLWRLNDCSVFDRNARVCFSSYKRCDRCHEWRWCQKFLQESISSYIVVEELSFGSVQGFPYDDFTEHILHYLLLDVINDRVGTTLGVVLRRAEIVVQAFFYKFC